MNDIPNERFKRVQYKYSVGTDCLFQVHRK